MFSRIRFFSAGESHGPRISAILDGLPAGFSIDVDAINHDLSRRQKGYGATARMKIERDRVVLTGGWMAGHTTGAPVAMEILNRDWKNWKERDIPPMTLPRPGHADLTGAVKYNHPDLRLSLERASARETAMRVAAGSLCKQILAQFGVEIGGYVVQVGEARAPFDGIVDAETYRARFSGALESEMACPDETASAAMREAVKRCRKAKDTLGGVLEVVALGVPSGLGSYTQWDTRLEARIAMVMLSIQAMKGVEIGPAFVNAGKRGTEVHDAIVRDESGALSRETNRAGGFEGGITTGEPIVVRVAKKPISTTLDPRRTVDLATGEPGVTEYERSDFCAVPRAVPIVEAMLAMVLTDAMLQKLGGDSLSEMKPRFEALRRNHLDDFQLRNTPWRFGYEG